MNSIDLNCDLGEGIGKDAEIIPYVSSVNIACGFHAGDSLMMHKTVKLAKEHGVKIGAHPSFQDIEGFGRRNIQILPSEAYAITVYQIGALLGFVKANDATLHHVKPHGALYNMASRDKDLADAIAKAIFDVDPDLVLYGLAGSELIRAGEKVGLSVYHEVFADRTYQNDGSLTPRTEQDAVIHDVDDAIEQVLAIVDREEITAIDGSLLPIKANTVCIHGDTEEAVAFAQQLTRELKLLGIMLDK
ncbi:5-oxoprolinase subunit PxpA [Saliterribacillus persicus]|uniref:5-oxoprolinase subunit A n=1 Tax=Saliterribacillus persicus TaxID=930114 RepID=A0A368Y4U2_9BACI|nr:5-oxoprolinase subunit PxpA [Saliterribacillus persicus]RCW74749.1 UPF0271 protein [Saliterribacillus persicus]